MTTSLSNDPVKLGRCCSLLPAENSRSAPTPCKDEVCVTRNSVPGSMTRSLCAVVTVAAGREGLTAWPMGLATPWPVGLATAWPTGLAPVRDAGIPDKANTTFPYDGTVELKLTALTESLPLGGAMTDAFSLGGFKCTEVGGLATVVMVATPGLFSLSEASLLSVLETHQEIHSS